jgi:pantetheine-phosphate adenylyltransferase
LVIAIYPGSFDPVTNGHLDIATRASKLFEKLIIAVYAHPAKNIMFPIEERVRLVRSAVENLPNVTVESFDTLFVDFARQCGASVMVRGLRMSADFDHEFEMAMMNRYLDPDLELVTMMASLRYQFLSSSLIKEASALSGKINNLVPECVAEALRQRSENL